MLCFIFHFTLYTNNHIPMQAKIIMDDTSNLWMMRIFYSSSSVFRGIRVLPFLVCIVLCRLLLSFLAIVLSVIRMVVGFTTTYVISDYHHYCCEFESWSGELYSIKHYVIKFVNVGGFFRVFRFPSPIQLTATIKLKYCWKWR